MAENGRGDFCSWQSSKHYTLFQFDNILSCEWLWVPAFYIVLAKNHFINHFSYLFVVLLNETWYCLQLYGIHLISNFEMYCKAKFLLLSNFIWCHIQAFLTDKPLSSLTGSRLASQKLMKMMLLKISCQKILASSLSCCLWICSDVT